jgi:acetyl esterase/lipase
MTMQTEDILDLKPPAADERIAYGTDPNQFLDLRRAKKSLQRAVAFIHGGYWRAKYDLMHASHLCEALRNSGWSTFNIEYRRVGNPGGAWPGTFSDLRAALQLIFSSAKKWEFAPENLVVMGHSAGGQLALALAGHDERIKKAASLAGVLNLQKAYDLHLSHDAVVEFLGGTPAQMPDHYREASPVQLRIKAKQLIVHGDKDDVVPVEISREYVTLKGAKEWVEPLVLPGAGHFEVIDPRTKEWKQIEAALNKI